MGQAAEVIVEELVLALVGLSAGAAVAGGLFSFIVELGVIADFADRTQSDVGKIMGISQVQVSRSEKRIIEKLRKKGGR